ncbi:MAG: PEP-CTERM sorting domain-containing protein, partial [Rugosibacter sp.]|nr:PEP-CTERM sorting domain-containing protein [Rugosibacter sp.]
AWLRTTASSQPWPKCSQQSNNASTAGDNPIRCCVDYAALFKTLCLDTIALSGFGIGGLGYDLSDNTLWGGSTAPFGTVYHLALDGTVLGSFVTGTAFHDGLEIGDINGNGNTVPEPSTILLLGAGLAALARRHRCN